MVTSLTGPTTIGTVEVAPAAARAPPEVKV